MLTKKDKAALRLAVVMADEWRGEITGAPYDDDAWVTLNALQEEHTAKIDAMRAALKKLGIRPPPRKEF